MNSWLVNRDIAATRSTLFQFAQTDRLFRSLHRSPNKKLKKRHFGAVNAIDIEKINGRQYSLLKKLSHSNYPSLLSGGAESVVNIWDLEQDNLDHEPTIIDTLATIPQSGHYFARIFLILRHKGHEYAITAVRWWPADTGMFTTSSFDKYLKVWDTNALEVPHLVQTRR